MVREILAELRIVGWIWVGIILVLSRVGDRNRFTLVGIVTILVMLVSGDFLFVDIEPSSFLLIGMLRVPKNPSQVPYPRKFRNNLNNLIRAGQSSVNSIQIHLLHCQMI